MSGVDEAVAAHIDGPREDRGGEVGHERDVAGVGHVLNDHFLIAMPDMDDPFFENSVIYVCEHNEEGALGIIINKPSPITMDMIFAATDRNIPLRMQHEHVMMGGPVQIDRGYVVHTPVGNWQNSMIVSDDIALTSSRDVIEKLIA